MRRSGGRRWPTGYGGRCAFDLIRVSCVAYQMTSPVMRSQWCWMHRDLAIGAKSPCDMCLFIVIHFLDCEECMEVLSKHHAASRQSIPANARNTDGPRERDRDPRPDCAWGSWTLRSNANLDGPTIVGKGVLWTDAGTNYGGETAQEQHHPRG